MDIACPNCAATYRVPEALVAQGKPLRCAACGETWVPEIPPAPEAAPEEAPAAESHAPEPAPAEPVAAESAPAPPEAAPEPPPSPPAPARPASPLAPPPLHPPVLRGRAPRLRSGATLRLAWAASIATLLLVLAGLAVYGDAIAAAWPPFARVTALLGG